MKFDAPNPFLKPPVTNVPRRTLVQKTFEQAGVDVLDVLTDEGEEEIDQPTFDPPPSPEAVEIYLSASEQRDAYERQWLRELYEREQTRLESFFGRAITIDPLPPGVTVERIEAWRTQGFEPHFLPKTRDILQSDGTLHAFPGWERMPAYATGGVLGLEKSKIHSSSFVLKQNWVLWDTRPMPSETAEPSLYEQDVFGETLKDLRQRNIISSSRDRSRDAGLITDLRTRFSLTYKELQDPRVKRACARILGVPETTLHLPTHIEHSILYALHSEPTAARSGSRVTEWFDDVYRPYPGSNQALHGAVPGYIAASGAESHKPIIGFRFLVRLSSKGVPIVGAGKARS